jgi:hypothetical protein
VPAADDAIPFNRSRVHQISMLLCSYITNSGNKNLRFSSIDPLRCYIEIEEHPIVRKPTARTQHGFHCQHLGPDI